MNRRTFLKSLTAACGAAVVCPGKLVKPDPWVKAAALREKNVAITCYGKHGQHCVCNSCVDDIMTDSLPPLKWTYYGVSYNFGSRPSGYIVIKA